mgnify:CR=1 FL=1
MVNILKSLVFNLTLFIGISFNICQIYVYIFDSVKLFDIFNYIAGIYIIYFSLISSIFTIFIIFLLLDLTLVPYLVKIFLKRSKKWVNKKNLYLADLSKVFL